MERKQVTKVITNLQKWKGNWNYTFEAWEVAEGIIKDNLLEVLKNSGTDWHIH